MKAITINEFGGVDKLRLDGIPSPKIGINDALVKVAYCGVNRLDIWIRKGARQTKGFPHVMGSEISGEIAELGTGVSGFSVGEKVAVFPWLFCGRCIKCLEAAENRCQSGGTIGRNIDGGYAEYVSVPSQNLLALPKNVNPESASAVILAAVTAMRMLKRAKLQRGETVVVLAAGSGVGSSAVQLAKIAGCKVIACAGSDKKLGLAKKLGADEVINYSATDFDKEVLRLTGSKGADVIVEQVGKDTWSKSMACIATGGRIVTCGATSGSDARIDLLQLFAKQITIIGSSGGTRADLQEVLELVSSGLFKPIIDSVFPLENAADAHEKLENRDYFGKILLKP